MDPFPKWQTTPKTHLKEKYPQECRLLLDGILIGFRLLTAFRQVFHGGLPVPIFIPGGERHSESQIINLCRKRL